MNNYHLAGSNSLTFSHPSIHSQYQLLPKSRSLRSAGASPSCRRREVGVTSWTSRRFYRDEPTFDLPNTPTHTILKFTLQEPVGDPAPTVPAPATPTEDIQELQSNAFCHALKFKVSATFLTSTQVVFSQTRNYSNNAWSLTSDELTELRSRTCRNTSTVCIRAAALNNSNQPNQKKTKKKHKLSFISPALYTI